MTDKNVPAGFVDGDPLLDEILAEPGMADAVKNIDHGVADMNRIYAQGLAEIHKFAAQTQSELAERMGVGQAAVSRIEGRDDLLGQFDVDAVDLAVSQAAGLPELLATNRGASDRRLSRERHRPAAPSCTALGAGAVRLTGLCTWLDPSVSPWVSGGVAAGSRPPTTSEPSSR